MQSCASAAKLRGGGPILETGVSTPLPASGDRHLGLSSDTDDVLFVRLRELVLSECLSHAARNTTPVGTSPVVTRRHRATSNLRASATIIVLRFVPALAVCARYHWVNALSFWWSKNRQANWIMPRRTRALPAFATHMANEPKCPSGEFLNQVNQL